MLKARGKGADESKSAAAMLAAAIWTMALGDTVVNLPVASSTALAETINGWIPSTQGGTVTGSVYIPNATFAANGSNFYTFNVFKRTNGGASVLLATANTSVNGLTAWTPFPLTIQAGVAVAANDVLTCTIVATGAPAAFPAGQFVCNVN